MKYIQKNLEPEEFIAWKQQESENLHGKTGKAQWEHFPSSCPKPEDQEELILYYSKTELKESILLEQGFLCCYCNQHIENNHRTVLEHLDDKGTHDTDTLLYTNILASCLGGQKDPKPRDLHCDANKKQKNLPVKPTDEICETLLYFQVNGEAKGANTEADTTISVLNLNIKTLVRERKKAIDGFIYDDSGQLIDTDIARILADKMKQRQASDRFVEFCSTIRRRVF